MQDTMTAIGTVAASQTDTSLVAAVTGKRILVTSLAVSCGSTASSTVFNTNAAITNEVQTVTVDATGGTFTITYSGQTTAANAFDIAAATLQTNLEALSNLVPGDVTVTGGPGAAGGGTPYTLTFGGSLADTNVAAVTTNAGSLTGGAGTATVATVTGGGPPGTAVTPTFQGSVVLPASSGWFTTSLGEGLSVTTGAGSTTGILVNYKLIG